MDPRTAENPPDLVTMMDGILPDRSLEVNASLGLVSERGERRSSDRRESSRLDQHEG